MISRVGNIRTSTIIISFLLLISQLLIAQHKAMIVVDQSGKGDYRTPTEAIAALPMFNYQRTMIYIKNGTYEEKIRLDQDNIALEGENCFKTIIQFDQLRSDWDQAKDSIGPHAFAIYGTGTGTIILNCRFSERMSDEPIYRVTYADSTRNRPFNWGARYYFYNCHRKNGDYEWFKNNLITAKESPKPEEITASWTFGGQWDPESTFGPTILKYAISENFVLFRFSEIISTVGHPVLKSVTGKLLTYHSGGGSDTVRINAEYRVVNSDLKGLTVVNDGKLLGTIASINERPADLNI